MHIFIFDCSVIPVAATFVDSCCCSVSASFVTEVFALRWDHRAFTGFNLGFGITKTWRNLDMSNSNWKPFSAAPTPAEKILSTLQSRVVKPKEGKKYKASSFKTYFYVISELI